MWLASLEHRITIITVANSEADAVQPIAGSLCPPPVGSINRGLKGARPHAQFICSKVSLMPIKWSEKLRTGIQSIDDEHWKIIEISQKIQCRPGIENDVDVRHLIDEFNTAYRSHLINEEFIMRELNYPEFGAHADEHEALLCILNKIPQMSGSSHEECQKLCFLILQWITSHIEGAEMKFADFVWGRSG